MNSRKKKSVVWFLLSVCAALPARAQWAVIDVQAIARLAQQIQTMEQQLQTARSQLSQAQQSFNSLTGTRGMQYLLSGIDRNYLPTSGQQLVTLLQGGSAGYPQLSASLNSTIAANAILTPTQLAALSVDSQQLIMAARQAAAWRQVMGAAALTDSSGRFSELQSLITAIGSAEDPKAILDLQARIGAELGMLHNEQTKLQVLEQSARAQEAANAQMLREQTIAAHGSFASRFQPVP